jgi:hypothetical protein
VAFEQTACLLGRQPVRDVVILEDLCERPPAVMLADHVLRDAFLLLRARPQKRKRAGQCIAEPHRRDCIVGSVKGPAAAGRFAERMVYGRDDGGSPEQVLIWIERRPGALWAVGRQVNPQHRESRDPRADDYVWEGHELDDCLDAANAVLEDDAVVSEEIGATAKVKPFRRDELLAPLEKFFFGR